MEISLNNGADLLDRAYAQILSNDVAVGMDFLVFGLQELRERSSVEDWNQFARSQCVNHLLKELLHQSPYARRAFEKPRGYAGDAEVLDLVYGVATLPPDTTELGKQIYQHEIESPGGKSARARRDLIASILDSLPINTASPRVLSIACGHLREAQLSKAVMEGKIQEFIALDQDPLSLSVVEKEFTGKCVKPVRKRIKDLFSAKTEFQDFDFVYATGLYDYLSQAMATDLTTNLFKMLKPGGRLLIANYAPNWRDIGYVEAFMDWWLIYRDEDNITRLASGIPADEIGRLKTFRDEYENIVFLELQRDSNSRFEKI